MNSNDEKRTLKLAKIAQEGAMAFFEEVNSHELDGAEYVQMILSFLYTFMLAAKHWPKEGRHLIGDAFQSLALELKKEDVNERKK